MNETLDNQRGQSVNGISNEGSCPNCMFVAQRLFFNFAFVQMSYISYSVTIVGAISFIFTSLSYLITVTVVTLRYVE